METRFEAKLISELESHSRTIRGEMLLLDRKVQQAIDRMGAVEEKVDYVARRLLEQGAAIATHLDFVYQSLRNEQDEDEESSQELRSVVRKLLQRRSRPEYVVSF